MSTLIGTARLDYSMKSALNLSNRAGFSCTITYPKRVHELGLIFLRLEAFRILITSSIKFGSKRFVALNPTVSSALTSKQIELH